jgi:hypothetical protein
VSSGDSEHHNSKEWSMSTWQKSTLVDWASLRIRGGDGTDDNAGADDDKNADDVNQDDDSSDDAADEDSSSGTVSKADFDALQKKFDAQKNQLRAADKTKSAAQKQLEDLQRKEKSDLENAQADVKKLSEENAGWQGKYEKLALTNAFLTESACAKIQWHDPLVAQAAAKLSDLTINEDGEVEGMDAIVKKLAKEKPFLVNSSSEADEDTTNGTKITSGSKVGKGSTGKGKPGQLSREELIKRFPALG